MGKRINMALEYCLANIEFWELQHQALRNVTSALHEASFGSREDRELNAAVNVLDQRVFYKLHHAYAEFFAASNFGTEEQQRAARKLAYKKYFEKGMSIIHMFNTELKLPPHVQPVQWPAGLEEELRKEIEAEMAKEE